MPATRSAVISSFRYRNAKAAIELLCSVFGFTKHAVFEDGGIVVHAELVLGSSMIMLGSVRDDNPSANAYGDLIVQPDEIGNRETRTAYLMVPDADEVYARAKAAGFPMESDIKEESYGGRGFTCRDLEGRVWSVGTYDPFASMPA